MTSELQKSQRLRDANDRNTEQDQREHKAQFEGVTIDITRERQGAFYAALANAGKGSKILYHLGPHCAGAHKKDARAAFEGGSVLLTVRKRDRFVFEYLAIPLASKGA